MGPLICPRGLKPFRRNSSHATVAKNAENGLKAVRLSSISLITFIPVSVSRVTDGYASEG